MIPGTSQFGAAHRPGKLGENMKKRCAGSIDHNNIAFDPVLRDGDRDLYAKRKTRGVILFKYNLNFVYTSRNQ